MDCNHGLWADGLDGEPFGTTSTWPTSFASGDVKIAFSRSLGVVQEPPIVSAQIPSLKGHRPSISFVHQ